MPQKVKTKDVPALGVEEESKDTTGMLVADHGELLPLLSKLLSLVAGPFKNTKMFKS